MDPKPRPPETAPQYVVDGLERQGPETLEDLAEWAIELAQFKEQPPREEIEDEIPNDAEVEGRDDETGGWVYTKYIPCGKDRCDCNGGTGHGPYRYRYYYGEDGNLTSEYLGKAAE